MNIIGKSKRATQNRVIALFSPRSSSEMPIHDAVPIAVETLRRDLLNSEETTQILQAAVDSIRRRLR
jgi:hypothetical protein